MKKFVIQQMTHDHEARFGVDTIEGDAVAIAKYGLGPAWTSPITMYWRDKHRLVASPDFVKSAIIPAGAPMTVIDQANHDKRFCKVSGSDANDIAKYPPNIVYHVESDRQKWDAYMVGIWRKGRRLCIHSSDRQIAQVKFPVVVENWLMRYELTVVDDLSDDDVAAVVMLTLYKDYESETHRMHRASFAKDFKLDMTFDKTLKSKYDSAFD